MQSIKIPKINSILSKQNKLKFSHQSQRQVEIVTAYPKNYKIKITQKNPTQKKKTYTILKIIKDSKTKFSRVLSKK